MLKKFIKKSLMLILSLSLTMTIFAVPLKIWAAGTAPGAPTGLLCELSSAPLGIEAANPKFSWIVNDTDKDETQSAYEIIVASSLANANSGIGDIWDSGKISSNASSNVAYAGTSLAAGTPYYWAVKTWDKNANVGIYSTPQMFVTALKSSWTATPIWSGTGNFAFLRKQITLPSKTIDKAIAFVTGRDTTSIRQFNYKFFINGTIIGVGPARNFNGKVPYNVYDVTSRLNSGTANVLAAECYSYDANKDFLMQLKVKYTDGTSDTFVTDGTWKAKDASSVYNMSATFSSYYKMGPENIDETKMPVGWNNTGFTDSSWSAATTKTAYTSSLVAQPMSPLQIVEVAPVSVVNKGSGNFFFDFGKEQIAGIKLTINGTAGAVINVRLGEETSGTNTVKYAARTGVTYNEAWTLIAGTQTIQNFGMRGFRYGEIVGSPDTTLNATKIHALVYRYPFNDSASSFTSSDSTLNSVYNFCKYSIKASNADIYQDCPTRERGPYEGDAYINQLSHYATDRDFQLARYTTEYLYYYPTWPTEYTTTSVLSAWADYMATGNSDALNIDYAKLQTKTYESLMNANSLVQESSTSNDLVDWPSSMRDGYVFTTINTVVNAFNAAALKTLANIAGVLGKTADQTNYNTKYTSQINSMNSLLYDSANNAYNDGQTSTHKSVHASIFPLALGITPANKAISVGNYIAGKGMLCSPYGGQYMLQALYNAGLGDNALAMMTSTNMNSWYHMMNGLGATTVTEAWDPSQKSNMSFCHAWSSAPANIIPNYLMGITPLQAGYSKIQIKPQTGALSSASVDLPTIKGNVHLDITKNANYTMNVNIPANTTAKVYVPTYGGTGVSVLVDGVATTGTVNGSYLSFDNIGSGGHTFQIALPNSISFSDTFSGASLSNWSPNTNCTLSSGAMSIGINGYTSCITGSAWTDYTFTSDVTIGAVAVGLNFRVSDSNNYYMWQLNSSSSQLKIHKKVNGTFTVFKTVPYSFATGIKYTVTIAASGSTISTYINGALVDTTTDTTFTKGTIGFRTGSTESGTLDNITVTNNFSDTFSGTSLSNWSPNTNCTLSSGAMNIGINGYTSCITGSAWTDYTFTSDVTIGAVAIGLNFRVSDSNNYYMWQLNSSSSQLKIHKKVNGTFTVLKTVPYSFVTGIKYTVTIAASGSTIRAYINGTLIDTTTDTTFTQGTIGFRTGATESGTIDNVAITI